ncbi:protein FAR1-RELATED SEQUENCE 5-like [Macadamia integrifolia]|uniref:protein FAR1-RELATED SEQUENCE 5-like n=1 Tax=Macadamia integrifolia TaxID=60698 RepID=UPI001C50207C|nr:protein FAR1-RELATED SEQUENCE 5-like [Macadamia integrifolia]
MMNLMASTLGEGFGFIESEKGSNGRTLDEHETKEDEILDFCDSQVHRNNEMTLEEVSIELTPNDKPLEPYIEMSFNSVDDAREFYSSYAKHIGFTVRTNRIRHSQKNRTIIARDYVCSREGFRAAKHTLRKDRVLPPRPITREGCKAMIRVAVRDGGKWVVTKFVPEHNHNLMTQSKVPGQRPSMSEVSSRSAVIDNCI